MLNIPLMSNNIIEEDVSELIKFLENTDHFTQGAKVREFEKAWSDWLGVKYCVFVNSGSSANFITMMAIAEKYGIGEVIVPTIAWSSDISSVILAGHTPVFVDINLNNLAMSEKEIFSKITKNTKAIFLTHVLGFNGISNTLLETLKKLEIPLIEDVCESHGAYFHEKKLGSLGYASNFSFYYAHHMSTIEGGMICTNDFEFYKLSRLFRSHGLLRECDDQEMISATQKEYPELHSEFIFMTPGFNMRSTELNAVIGLNQLKRLDSNISKRTENFKLFLNNLDSEKYFTDFDIKGSSNYAFVIILNEKYKNLFDKLTNLLINEKVEFRRGTAGGGNLARQPFVRKRFPNINPSTYKNAEYIHKYGIYVGNYPDLETNKIIELTKLLNSLE